MRPVSSVDVAQLGPPAAQPGGHVRCPEGVAPAVLGFEQAQLGAGMRPLTAGRDPHSRRPARPPGSPRAPAPRPPPVRDLGVLHPAPPLPAPPDPAGGTRPALPS